MHIYVGLRELEVKGDYFISYQDLHVTKKLHLKSSSFILFIVTIHTLKLRCYFLHASISLSFDLLTMSSRPFPKGPVLINQ